MTLQVFNHIDTEKKQEIKQGLKAGILIVVLNALGQGVILTTNMQLILYISQIALNKTI